MNFHYDSILIGHYLIQIFAFFLLYISGAGIVLLITNMAQKLRILRFYPIYPIVGFLFYAIWMYCGYLLKMRLIPMSLTYFITTSALFLYFRSIALPFVKKSLRIPRSVTLLLIVSSIYLLFIGANGLSSDDIFRHAVIVKNIANAPLLSMTPFITSFDIKSNLMNSNYLYSGPHTYLAFMSAILNADSSLITYHCGILFGLVIICSYMVFFRYIFTPFSKFSYIAIAAFLLIYEIFPTRGWAVPSKLVDHLFLAWAGLYIYFVFRAKVVRLPVIILTFLGIMLILIHSQVALLVAMTLLAVHLFNLYRSNFREAATLALYSLFAAALGIVFLLPKFELYQDISSQLGHINYYKSKINFLKFTDKLYALHPISGFDLWLLLSVLFSILILIYLLSIRKFKNFPILSFLVIMNLFSYLMFINPIFVTFINENFSDVILIRAKSIASLTSITTFVFAAVVLLPRIKVLRLHKSRIFSFLIYSCTVIITFFGFLPTSSKFFAQINLRDDSLLALYGPSLPQAARHLELRNLLENIPPNSRVLTDNRELVGAFRPVIFAGDFLPYLSTIQEANAKYSAFFDLDETIDNSLKVILENEIDYIFLSPANAHLLWLKFVPSLPPQLEVIGSMVAPDLGVAGNQYVLFKVKKVTENFPASPHFCDNKVQITTFLRDNESILDTPKDVANLTDAKLTTGLLWKGRAGSIYSLKIKFRGNINSATLSLNIPRQNKYYDFNKIFIFTKLGDSPSRITEINPEYIEKEEGLTSIELQNPFDEVVVAFSAKKKLIRLSEISLTNCVVKTSLQ